MNLFILIGTHLLLTILFIARPWFSRQNVFFGVVFADHGIAAHPRARRIRRRYLVATATAALILLAALILSLARLKNEQAFAFILIGIYITLTAAELLFFALAHRRVKQLKAEAQPDDQLTASKMIVDIGTDERKTVPPFYWFLVLVPLFLATAMIAVLGYPHMPERVPVHFGLSGPDRWGTKSWGTVLSPLFLELLIGTIILLTRRAPASVKGNPSAAPGYVRYRKIMVLLMIGFCLLTELIFLLATLSMLTRVAPLWFSAVITADFLLPGAMLAVYFRFARNRQPAGNILDDDDKWIWGLFYFNRSDPAVFVEKRVGVGYTVNMANPGAWLMLAAILLLIIAAFLLH